MKKNEKKYNEGFKKKNMKVLEEIAVLQR